MACRNGFGVDGVVVALGTDSTSKQRLGVEIGADRGSCHGVRGLSSISACGCGKTGDVEKGAVQGDGSGSFGLICSSACDRVHGVAGQMAAGRACGVATGTAAEKAGIKGAPALRTESACEARESVPKATAGPGLSTAGVCSSGFGASSKRGPSASPSSGTGDIGAATADRPARGTILKEPQACTAHDSCGEAKAEREGVPFDTGSVELGAGRC